MRMQSQIFNSFLFLIAIPTVVFFVIIIGISTSVIERRTISASELVVKESVKRIDILLNSYRKASMQMYFNGNVMDYLEAGVSGGVVPGQGKLIIEEILKSIVNADKYLMSAVVRTADTMMVEGSSFPGISEYLDSNSERSHELAGQIAWIPSRKLKSVFGLDAYYFGAMRMIRRNDRKIGELLFLVRNEFFDDIYAGAIPDNKGNDLVVAPDGTIVSSPNEALIGTTMEDDRFDEILSGELGKNGFLLTRRNREADYLIYSQSEESGWYFVRELEGKDVLSDIIRLRRSFAAIIALFCIFLVFLSYLLSRGLSRPLKNLAGYIDRIGIEHMDVATVGSRWIGDEITKLEERLFAMSSRIQALIQEVSRKERLKNKAELEALRNHISPHFIYNTLDTIRWMAIMNKQDNIRVMVSALDKLMRYAADSEKVLIRLDEEMDIIREYVLIQRMRYSDIELVVDVPAEIGGKLINKFIIQTIVENSIIHGFRDNVGAGTIRIEATVTEGVLVLAVEDNGKGFDSTTVNDDTYPHTGLKSVNRRLTLNYGPEFGVSVTSSSGKGTRVVLRLPIIG